MDVQRFEDLQHLGEFSAGMTGFDVGDEAA